MKRSRNLLHLNKLEEFATWAEANGYTAEEEKGDYEVLRLRRNPLPGDGRVSPPLCFYLRQGAEHVTAHDAGYELVRRWLRERKVAR